jgi:molecular chaperone GrpE
MAKSQELNASEENEVQKQDSQEGQEHTAIEEAGAKAEGSGGAENGGSPDASGKTGNGTAAELQETKDKYIRLFAEFENFRRRTARENFDLMASANAKLLGKLTEVLDNFNLAFDPKLKAEKREDFEKGLRLIYSKFKEILSDEGLTEVDPVKEEFDPNLHEALMQQPSDEVPENHIIQVLQKGYKVKNKILKHAKVIVSTGKP